MSDWSALSFWGKLTKPVDIVAVNRIPPGFTIYATGQADGVVSSPGKRNGDALKFDHASTAKRFQLMSPWYAIGGRVIWEGADLADYMCAKLVAPATTGSNTTGDFNKVAVPALGCNIFVPASPGTGAWTLDLTAKFTSTDVLVCTPVPSPGNTGYFDYDIDTNTLTVSTPGAGSYNLFDAEIDLFHFSHKIWGKKLDGAETSLEIPDVIAKALLPNWQVLFELTTTKTTGIGVGIIMITAVKGNV